MQPKRSRLSATIIAILIFGAIGAAYMLYTRVGRGGPGMDIPIPLAVIQQSVSAQFPLNQGRIELRDPEVVLTPGSDRIGMKMEVRAPMIATTANLEADGKLRYDPDSGAFLLDDPRLNDLHAHGLLGGLMNGARGAINPVLKTLLRTVRIYQLDNSLQSTVARAGLRKVRVEDGRVVVTLGLKH